MVMDVSVSVRVGKVGRMPRRESWGVGESPWRVCRLLWFTTPSLDGIRRKLERHLWVGAAGWGGRRHSVG